MERIFGNSLRVVPLPVNAFILTLQRMGVSPTGKRVSVPFRAKYVSAGAKLKAVAESGAPIIEAPIKAAVASLFMGQSCEFLIRYLLAKIGFCPPARSPTFPPRHSGRSAKPG